MKADTKDCGMIALVQLHSWLRVVRRVEFKRTQRGKAHASMAKTFALYRNIVKPSQTVHCGTYSPAELMPNVLEGSESITRGREFDKEGPNLEDSRVVLVYE